MSVFRATILAVGTELTTGQITNRNAAWIGDRLSRLGFSVTLQETVPDDRALILGALERCSRDSELLVITGGLGPTTDDFTRDVVADWAGRALEYHEPSWTKIIARLTDRGIRVSESNRRQCHYPAGAVVLDNAEGTADAFRLEVGDAGAVPVVVLPGPPREGQHVWDRHLDAWLRARFAGLAPMRVERFHCLGVGEAILGEIVEKAVADSGVAGIQTGYRFSLPYVEVKLMLPASIPPRDADAAIAQVASEIAPYAVARGDQDLARMFLDALAREKPAGLATVLDLGSDGALSARLLGELKRSEYHALAPHLELMSRFGIDSDPSTLPDSSNDWLFALFPNGRAAIVGPDGKFERTLPSPYAGAAMRDRLRLYHTELALRFFGEIYSLPKA